MSYPQPYHPRPRRPERTPSTNDIIPFPPSAPAAAGTYPSQAIQQPRLPFTAEDPRPGSSGSSRSFSRPGPQQYSPQQYSPQQYSPQQYSPQQYAPRPGTSSSNRQDFRPGTASSSHSNFRPGPGPGTSSPSRPDYRQVTSSPSRSDFRQGSSSPARPDYRPAAASSPRSGPDYRPGTGSSSRGQPPFNPSHARVTSHDATSSPLKQATTQAELQEVPLNDPHAPALAPQPNRPPTLPPPPANLPAPTTRSRFSDASETNAAAAARFTAIDSRSWPRLVQWTLLPLILVMSGAVAILMGHSLSLYGGLKVAGTIDYSVATHPVWPSDLSLLPTWLLLAVGFCSFCCSIVVWGLSLRERFMKPVKRLAGVRIGMGIFFVGAWIGALVVYKLFETGDDGDSLGKYSCDHKSDDVVGGFEIARVCTEQSVGFGLAITSAILEIALIAAFAMRTVMNKKDGADGALSEKQAGKNPA